MAELKTKPTQISVETFLDSITDATKREDSKTLIRMMKSITGKPAVMWGPSIIGFGTYHYVYDSGCEGDICLSGFSPRKSALTIYLMCGCADRFAATLSKLGKAKVGKGCVYIKKLADVDLNVLREMIEISVAETKGRAKSDPKTKSKSAPKSESKPKTALKTGRASKPVRKGGRSSR